MNKLLNFILFFIYTICAYAQDGAIDSSFATFGTYAASSNLVFNSVAQQASGKLLLIGGIKYSGVVKNAVIERRNFNGTADSSFGISGRVEFGWPTKVGELNNIIILPNNKILVAGNLQDSGNSNNTQFLLGRFHSDGILDSSFGVNGLMLLASANKVLNRMAVQSTGKIILQSDSFLYRLESNGSLDISFGNNGKLNIPNNNNLVIQHDDKILTCKWGTDSTLELRLNPLSNMMIRF